MIHGTCAEGAVAPKNNKCNLRFNNQCPYICQRNAFIAATLACTNYPYIFTEHLNAGQLPQRKVVILDECHTVERQILGFIELSLSEETVEEWTGKVKHMPALETLTEFNIWVKRVYL